MKSPKNNNSGALNWIYKNSKKYIPSIAVCTLISAVTSVAYVVLAYVSSFVIDIAIGKKQGDIKFYITMLFLLILLQAVLNIAGSLMGAKVTGKLENSFRLSFFKSIMQKEYRSISGIHSGDILNRFTSDIDVVVSSVVSIIPGVVSFFARLVAAFIVLVSLSRSLGLAVLVIGVVIGILARIYSKFIKQIHKQVQEASGNTRSFMQECTENIVVVKSFNSSKSFGEKLTDLMLKSYKLKIKRSLIANISNSTKYIIFTGGYYVALSFGAFLISGGSMTYGSLLALLNIISNIRRPLTNMSGLLPQYYQALASAERIMEIEQLPSEKQPLEKEKINNIFGSLKGISMRKLCFSYDHQRQILNKVDMDINRGELVALVGGSGEGKSTLFRILLGLYTKDSGEVVAKAEKNYEVDSTLRGLFAYVPQGNLILSGTIGDNIRFCNTNATENEVIEAAKVADLYDFVSGLPNGFDTVVGERGIGLSEGQLQRISIARAILCNAPVLLLDECTSALDEATEKRVLNNIKEKGDITAILISHRPAALKICDKVYSIENGVARLED